MAQNNDLISRSALRSAVGEDINRCYRLGVGSVGPLTHFLEQIDSAPAIDAEPVRHGRWINDCMEIVCSECKTVYADEIVFMNKDFKFENLPYCPNCGAKMDAEVKG